MKGAALLFSLGLFAIAVGVGTYSASLPIAAEPDDVTVLVDDIVLHGDLSKPNGGGPFPAVLWNHGSGGPDPSVFSVLGQLFSSRGYVLFIPHRRGYGRSPRHPLVDQFRAEKQVDTRNKVQLELMDIHMKDVVGAVRYLEKLPFVGSQTDCI